MNPKLIKTEKQHDAALKHADKLMSAKPGTRQGDELELWVFLIKAYEEVHYPIAMPNPIAAIRFRMEQQGLRRADLIPYIGSKSKVSEVLNGQRSLSLAMIRKIHEGLSIPLDILIGDKTSGRRAKKAARPNSQPRVRERRIQL